MDRNVALTPTGSLQDYLKSFSYAEPRFSLILLGIFAGVGLALVAIGSLQRDRLHSIRGRRRKLGFAWRWARGWADVFRMVLRMGSRLIADAA